MEKLPKNFRKLKERYGPILEKLEEAGAMLREAGPIDGKTAHLIQLAAAAALRSEGAVHSHAKRAVKAGAGAEEIRHTIMLLTPTIGFPTVAAAMSWAEDVLEE
jgi:alkylhydroperoxidase/carboxymuconolactone decarboxylase family protein YurZ